LAVVAPGDLRRAHIGVGRGSIEAGDAGEPVLPGRPTSESGRLRHGDGAPGTGRPLRWRVVMLAIPRGGAVENALDEV
jgi:hypothetical protein